MIVPKPVRTLVNSQVFFPMMEPSRREKILTARVYELEAAIKAARGFLTIHDLTAADEELYKVLRSSPEGDSKVG